MTRRSCSGIRRRGYQNLAKLLPSLLVKGFLDGPADERGVSHAAAHFAFEGADREQVLRGAGIAHG